MNPYVASSMITGGCTLAGVFLSGWMQTRRIDAQNRSALREQTGEIRQHVKGDGP